MKLYILFTLVGILVFCGWKTETEKQIKKAEWLIGTWENNTPKGCIYETWVKVNESVLFGKSYMIQEKDTLVFETIKLIQKQDSLFYIPTVKNQNNNVPVRFALKTVSDTVLVFENPKHDFPQVISYTKINADSLIAEISGTKNGKEHKQTFRMKKQH
ncbi:DUF6265 family protein [Parapedobacter tibetensis]|uniref:DUF6265 family protein n=1 Tax=Parapedobacter tibetensis TaxID=2972951 RepID=UPI00214DE130|nr:DUF6265 family protein [Parapedobacter tibetensis]